jgi:hypothetical protein
MPRTTRLIINDETALDGFPMDDIEKDFMLDLIRRYCSLYLVEILGFCLMDNHFLCRALHKKCYVKPRIM